MKMSKEALSSCLDELATGNVAARRWAKKILGNRRRGIFHQVLKDPTKATRLKVTPEELNQLKAIPEEDLRLIRATWKWSEELWDQFKLLVYRLARNFAKKVGMESKISDFNSEATVAFLKAVRGYDDRNFAFPTYFGMAIRVDLRRYVASLRGLTGSNETLLIAYQAKWQELVTANLPHSFEDIAIALELKEADRRRLWGTIQEPTAEGDLAESLANVVIDKSARAVDSDLIHAIGMVELSVLERDAWITRDAVRGLFPGAKKNMKAVAIEHDVSPQAVAYAADRANVKIVAKLRSVGYDK